MGGLPSRSSNRLCQKQKSVFFGSDGNEEARTMPLFTLFIFLFFFLFFFWWVPSWSSSVAPNQACAEPKVESRKLYSSGEVTETKKPGIVVFTLCAVARTTASYQGWVSGMYLSAKNKRKRRKETEEKRKEELDTKVVVVGIVHSSSYSWW